MPNPNIRLKPCFCCEAPTNLYLLDYGMPICEPCLCQLTAHIIGYTVRHPGQPYRVAIDLDASLTAQ